MPLIHVRLSWGDGLKGFEKFRASLGLDTCVICLLAWFVLSSPAYYLLSQSWMLSFRKLPDCTPWFISQVCGTESPSRVNRSR
ncbi:hypothetical protein CPC08DRAFT_706075 [Agrocybe pediades]|nr:hypothetical protein CPC08DRAFT_706075 [Agrocybe pediades]